MRYDPDVAPDAAEWLRTVEQERLAAVIQFHRWMPDARLHAAIHLAVESQLAEQLPAAVRTLERLRGQGLSRHDALHAIGSAVGEQIHAVLQGRAFNPDEYEMHLAALDAAAWRSQVPAAEPSRLEERRARRGARGA